MSETPPQPKWIREIRSFYSVFPEDLERQFYETTRSSTSEYASKQAPPRVWKRIGDEIVFTCRVDNLDHLARSILAFTKALDVYGNRLDKDGKLLDVKGSAWIAPFPHPNITLPIKGLASESEEKTAGLATEDTENAADVVPSDFDFLGPHIDAGFRIAKFASADSCALSVEVAWLVALACFDERSYPLKFRYSDRQIVKGVIGDHPYPVISIDTERSEKRKEVLFRERLLTGRDFAEPRLLADFLNAFMSDENIEQPVLDDTNKGERLLPSSYQIFKKAWDKEALEIQKRRSLEESSEEGEIFDAQGAHRASVTSDDLMKSMQAAREKTRSWRFSTRHLDGPNREGEES